MNILLVEDDEFLRGLISKKLMSEGFSISAAKNGEECVKKAKEEKPGLILLDMILPLMDGFEVLAKMKDDEATKSIPVIVLSNLDQKDDIDKALKLGATDYLIKAQFTPDEIAAKVKNILEPK
jgi:DNA-binding response OmpR family regulator